MVIINTGNSDKLFEYNGLQYRKGMYEVYYVLQTDGTNHVGIRHIEKTEEILVYPKSHEEFTVNGSTFATTTDLVTALSDILGFNQGGGGEIDSFYFNDGFVI